MWLGDFPPSRKRGQLRNPEGAGRALAACCPALGEVIVATPFEVANTLAIHESFGTIVGEVAEIAVGAQGEVKVERVVAGVDCGHVVNPRHVEMQIESGILYGLTAALFGEITIKDGRVEQSNFDTYQIARIADAPKIETHLVLSGGMKWGGIGEPGTPPIAPAICNAIFAATGKRIRKLPVGNVDLSGHA
jgi:isoquinoline 1-oxidoreductase subunit beta